MENVASGGYYDLDLDIDSILIDSGSVSEYFYLQDLKQRKIFLNSEITLETICDPVRHIMQYNKDDIHIPVEGRLPILLYITSNGGDVDAGFELIDIITNSKTPVYTINMGYQYSMGFLIGLAGHKRFATKHAKFLIHDGSAFVYNSGTKVQDQIEFYKRVEERTKQYVLEHSKISSEEYDSKLRVEWYMFCDEAKEKGLVDYAIGVDCDIDTII